MSTRPGEIGRSEAQRIAQETASLLSKASDERQYREHMLVSHARMEVKLDALQETMERHIEQDDQRFANVSQKVGNNTDNISKMIGMGILLIALAGFMMWLIDRATP